jgi:hypothetical protein
MYSVRTKIMQGRDNVFPQLFMCRNSRGRFIWDGDIPYRKDLRDLEPDQFETEQVQGSTSWVHSRKQSDFDVDDYDDIDGDFTDFQKAGPVQVK